MTSVKFTGNLKKDGVFYKVGTTANVEEPALSELLELGVIEVLDAAGAAPADETPTDEAKTEESTTPPVDDPVVPPAAETVIEAPLGGPQTPGDDTPVVSSPNSDEGNDVTPPVAPTPEQIAQDVSQI